MHLNWLAHVDKSFREVEGKTKMWKIDKLDRNSLKSKFLIYFGYCFENQQSQYHKNRMVFIHIINQLKLTIGV